jgi:hypothetical protein
MAKGRETFTPKISEKLSKTFEASFPEKLPEIDLTLKTTRDQINQNQLNQNQTPIYANFTQPGRSYREELYASRRFELNPSQNPNYAFRRLQNFLQDENIPTKVKEKKYFVRPGLVKHAVIYAGRRKKFNLMVKETIKRVVQIHESQK